MPKSTFLLLLFLALLAFSCTESDPLPDDSIKIEFGFECGWCAGSGFITITNTRIGYKRIIPCGENKGSDSDNDDFSADNWDQLISCFDQEYYTTLEYNQCNVCVDGCDEIIRVTKDEESHELRYNPGDTIPGLEALQEKLRALMSTYKQD